VSLTAVDQTLKDEGFVARVRVAIMRWARAQIVGATRHAGKDAFAKLAIRGDRRNVETIVRALAIDPSLNPAALVDDPAGDAALQAAVDSLVPPALALGLIYVADPDGVAP
jgi:hypothetical protein